MIATFLLVSLLAGCSPGKSASKSDSASTDSPLDDTSGCVPTTEIPNDGIDQDCDGADLADGDLDGWALEDDCDDGDASVHPGAFDACNGTDDDCDGIIDEDEPPVPWYPDADGDGWGEASRAIEACAPPKDYVAFAGDCDVDDPAVHPEEVERCNGIDDDCDGIVPEEEVDADRDGARICDGDCDDADATFHPGAAEACNGLDDDCDGVVPGDEMDGDGDGFATCEGDCDDGNASVGPGAVERCDNGADDDCNSIVDEDCPGCDIIVPVDYPSVQEAIDAALSGDLVCVAAGTFYENIDFGGAEIEVRGVHGPSETILDGSGAGTIVSFRSAEGPDAILRGFSLLHGMQKQGGGGIWIDGASPTLADLVVSENLSGCSYGIFGGGIRVDDGDPTLTNVIVSHNNALTGVDYEYGAGGGISLVSSSAILENVSVTDNVAGYQGCGVYTWDSDVVLNNVKVGYNSGCQGGGGGIYLHGGTADLTNVRIIANEAIEIYGATSGGGLKADGSEATLTNVVLADNHAYGVSDAWGGGLCLYYSTFVLTNVVILRNVASETAGGVYLSGSTADFTFSDIYDNYPADWHGMDDPTGTDGNIAEDPLFLDDALHVDSASPLVGAGDPSLLDPDGSPSDIGAFGGPGASAWDLDGDGYPSWWLPGAYDASTSPGLDCDDADSTVYPGSGC